jgi:hypothetical protein
MAKSRDLSPRHLTADEDFQKLLGLGCGLAGKGQFGSQAIANTTHGIAKLHEAGRLDATDGRVDAALAALEGDRSGAGGAGYDPAERGEYVWVSNEWVNPMNLISAKI